MVHPRVLVVAALMVAWTAGCAMPEEADMPAEDGLGMGAPTDLLAEARLDAFPDGEMGWIAWAWGDVPDDRSAAPGFAYAAQGSHALALDGEAHALAEGDAVFIPEGASVEADASDGLWRILLVPAEASHQGARFYSDPLEGIPQAPVDARFLVVTLEPGGMTHLHTHPGPEFIHVHEGRIEYETARTPAHVVEAGGSRTLEADTAVQKRNPFDEPAAFLSLFLVDPERPFVEEASFD